MGNHRTIMMKAACAAAILIGARSPACQAEQQGPPATLITLEEAGDSRASVGDLIGLKSTYPIIPGAMLSNLRVAIRGNSVRFVTVASTPQNVGGRPVVGAGSLSGFVVAERSGDAVITVTPVKLDGSDGEPKEYRIRVEAKRLPGR